MSPLVTSLLTALIVMGGRWAKGEKQSIQVVVGLMFLALILTVLGEANEKFGRQFGLLVVAGAVFAYGVPITRGLGLSRGNIGGGTGA